MLRYVLYGRWSRGASHKATRWLMLQYEISPPKLAWMTNSINRLWHAYGSGVCGRAEAFIHAPTPCVTIICGRYSANSPPV